MPSQMPSSFAAAAGQSTTRDPRNGGKCDGRGGSGDWARKDSKPATNGTLTLRRSSTNPLSQTPVPGESQIQNQPESLVPQQIIYDQCHDFRYSKQDFLDIFKRQQESGTDDESNVSHLFADGWTPGESHVSSGRPGWGKSHDGRDYYAPDICWDLLGDTQPVSLEEMSEHEKKLFKGDINSPFKPPSQSLKDSTVNGRKSSFSHGQGPNIFNHPSPVSSRPSTRRQQTNDSVITGLTSPNGANRFSRDDPSTYFSRKCEQKESLDERSEDKMSLPLGGLIRSNNTGSSLVTGQASPWGTSTNAAVSPMGAFGNFAMTNSNNTVPGEKRLVTSRSESRFFQTVSKDYSDDLSKPVERSWRPRQRTDTDPFADESPSVNISTLSDEIGQSNHKSNGFDTPNRLNNDEFGISEISGLHEQNHHTPRPIKEQTEPLSPSDTNPYRSPSGPLEDRKQIDIDTYNTDANMQDQMPGLGGITENGQSAFGIISRGLPGTAFDGSDRSQTSSATGSRVVPQLGGLSSLGTIGGLGGWPAASGSPMAMTDRESRPNYPSAFGNSIFGTVGDSQSPGHSHLTGMFGPPSNSSAAATSARGSKLGSLFPAAMQAQMQTSENDSVDNESRPNVTFGAIARGPFTPSRETECPIRSNRQACEDLFTQPDNPRSVAVLPNPDSSQAPTASSFNNTSQQCHQQSQVPSESVSNPQLLTSQLRMMVMPDRMRWLYLDPQAQVQGPFSGLEMHDWYKASFFTPDLSVKKLEDADFEPLGQLIRRIGNSREPFLVPQIGIPHGQPSTQAGAAFSPPTTGHGPGSVQPGVVQPPFANAFPSFGTTLTAEQQNNLERRKQEEQYLMARQREFLAQQQVNMKQIQMGALTSSLPSALHHSNIHNLQNQPSFGSISSSVGIPPQPPLANGPGYFDGLARQIPTNSLPGDFYRDEDISRLALRERHGQQVNPPFFPPDIQTHAHKIEDIDFAARLTEFEQLREHEIDDAPLKSASQPTQDLMESSLASQQPLPFEELVSGHKSEESEPQSNDSLTLTQRVQKTVSTKQVQSTASQKDSPSPWRKINSNISIPFPSPQTISPLPAPTAQRDRSKLPDSLIADNKSDSKVPEATPTQSIAPWVKDPIEVPKPVSIKEVAEAEAKKAAKAEENAVAARRATAEQELKSNVVQPGTAPPPGLPTTATWGNSTSPVHSVPIKSAWVKSITKPQDQPTKQKTLADIQKEEELRKQKLAIAAAAQSSASAHGSKRYADLASKATPSTTPAGGPTWFTVGAGGKVKVPTGPSASAQVPSQRSASSHVMSLPTRTQPKSTTGARNTPTSGTNNVNLARDELSKWAKATLEKGLNPGINGKMVNNYSRKKLTQIVNEFFTMLSSFPSEPSIIADSIYSQSQTMNGNDFAIEFIRRRNNAEKGTIESANSNSGSAFTNAGEKSGGWNEVAKKGPPKEEPAAGFKFVPNKKKSKK